MSSCKGMGKNGGRLEPRYFLPHGRYACGSGGGGWRRVVEVFWEDLGMIGGGDGLLAICSELLRITAVIRGNPCNSFYNSVKTGSAQSR